MAIIEIVIIYLACGAPFAVGRFLQNEKYFGLQNVLSSVGLLFGWPIVVPGFAKRIFDRWSQTKEYSPNEHDPDSRLPHIGKILENEWCHVFGETEIISFRDSLQRYVNISFALLHAGQILSPPEFELLNIAGHTDSAVGNACLSRRARQKLEIHRTASRTSFVDTIFQLHEAGSEAALAAAIDLAELIGDPEGVAELEAARMKSAESSAMAA